MDFLSGVGLLPDGVARIRLTAPRHRTQTVGVHANVALFAPDDSALYAMTWFAADGSVLRRVQAPRGYIKTCNGALDADGDIVPDKSCSPPG
jgi:hypothetical protein